MTALSDEDIEKLGGAEKAANMYRAKSITVFTKDRQGIYAQLKGDEVKVGDKIVTGGQQNLSNGSLVSVADKAGVGTEQPANKTNLYLGKANEIYRYIYSSSCFGRFD